MRQVSRETISKITDQVLAGTWAPGRAGPRTAIVYPVVFLDCMVLKIRDGASVLAMAIGMDGEREVLGMWFQANEGAKF